MLVELTNNMGPPARIEASQVVIYGDNGEPIAAVAAWGPNGCYKVVHAADPDFPRVMAALGVGRHKLVVVDKLSSAPPPRGAKLLAGPDL